MAIMVAGEGPQTAEIMLIGQNPGREEAKQGRPFVGKSGRYLDMVLRKNNLERDNLYITSVVKETTQVIDFIQDVPGVNEVHDIHIWTITSNIYALSAHLVIDDQMVSKSMDIVRTVRQELARRYNISHTTLQLECESCPTGCVCELVKHDGSAD